MIKMDRFIYKICTVLVMMHGCMVLNTNAQSANKLLADVKECYTSAKGIEASYSLRMLDASGFEMGTLDGVIKMEGKCFALNTEGIQVWFDGTDMWSLVEDSDEVNLSTPDETELQSMNPFVLLTLYEKGYNTLLVGENKVILTPMKVGGDVQSIELIIDLTKKLPTAILWKSSDGHILDIAVKSYQCNLQYNDSDFSFDASLYPDAEVIDLR